MGRLSRRELLQMGAFAGAMLRFERTSTAAERGMFVSLNGSLTGNMDWAEFVRLAASVGYGGADVNLTAAQKDGIDATKTLFASVGIRPGVISLPVRFSGEDGIFQDDLTRLGDNAAFAAAIGCPRMMAVLPPSSTTPKTELRTLLKERVTRMAEILGRSNVRLGLEFLGPMHFRTRQPHEFIWRMDEALEFSKECGSNIGLTLDAWHWHHAGATAADIVAAGKSRIVHVHVSDAKRQPREEVRDNQRLMPGEGVIALTTFFESLRKIGYEEAISPEPLGRIPSGTPPEDGARLGLQTTLYAMKRAGIG